MAEKYILVTGAAGYIGSIVTEELVRCGSRVIALDNLIQGHRASVCPQAVFVKGDLKNHRLLEEVFCRYPIEAVVHLAARTLVGESVADPQLYFRNNLVYALNLLGVMLKHGVKKLVFSSSCAIYGDAGSRKITEDTPKEPINPYGDAKLALEKVLHWYAQAYGLASISLRYFNAAGATERFGEDHHPETHLIPVVLRAALGGGSVTVFGTDYPTPDGSCIRDYVHVVDIARAHILALEKLSGSALCRAYNLGSGRGYSVLEVIETARRLTGANIPVIHGKRRPGDPPVLVADASLARQELGWEPSYAGLEEIVESAYRWMKKHPYGYGEKKRLAIRLA